MSLQENEESHKDEIEVLVSKVEEAKAEVAKLHEKLTRTTAEHDSKMDEVLASRKSEVNSLQDKISEKERVIVDLEACKAELNSEIQSLKTSTNDEIKVSSVLNISSRTT